MKLTSLNYNSSNENWLNLDFLPSNSRYILVYSPEFGTSIGKYNKNTELFEDVLRNGEKVNIIYWREMPRYVEHNNSL